MDGRENKLIELAGSKKFRRVACNGLNKMMRKKYQLNAAVIFLYGEMAVWKEKELRIQKQTAWSSSKTHDKLSC